jgi:hypothetical protein
LELNRLSPWESIVIRVANLVFALLGRTLDVLLLIWRPPLFRANLSLWWAEVDSDPYRWPRSFEAVRTVKESGQQLRELMYGEAPVFTAVWLLWRAGVGRGSRVLDIGAGRGRVLIAARWLGAHARGLELRPEHVGPMAPALKRIGASLEVADGLRAELGGPTHVFLNWCAFGDETKQRLSARLAALPVGTWLIAVTRAATGAPVVRQGWALFTWGPERVFLQRIAAP